MGAPAENNDLRVHLAAPFPLLGMTQLGMRQLRMTPPWHIQDRVDGTPRRRATLDDMEDPGSVLTGQLVPFPPEPEEPETDPSQAASGQVWRFLLEPRWLPWHLFAIVAVWGMLWL